jgi:hypothetical protein
MLGWKRVPPAYCLHGAAYHACTRTEGVAGTGPMGLVAQIFLALCDLLTPI